MKRATFEQICAWEPCGFYGDDDGENYTPARIRRLMGDKEFWTPQDIMALENVPWDDKYWALQRFLSESEQHELACRVAETCEIANDDQRVRRNELIQAKRAWVAGEISDGELEERREAYQTAYQAAYREAYQGAYRAADWASDWATYRAAYRAMEREACRAVDWAADCAADPADLLAAYEQFCGIALALIDEGEE
jgi:hypothetical protein